MNSADKYKAWHKPNKNTFNENGNIKKGQTYQGYYHVQYPEKYIGSPSGIIFRSSWEYSFCKWCDMSESVTAWSSEPTSCSYYDKVSKLNECKKLGLDPNNPRNWVKKNYHVDFWVKIKKADDIYEKWFIEIKPKSKLFKPKPPQSNASLKEQKRFNTLAKEFLINEEKFKAMKEWSEKNGAKFYVFTEVELTKFGIIGGKFDYKNET